MRNSLSYIFLLVSINAYAQFSLLVGVGYSSSSQDDLREFQNNAAKTALIPVETVNNYEASSHGNFGLSYSFSHKNELGISFLVKLSGARSGIQDSTGFYLIDQKTKLINIGVQYTRIIRTNFRTGLRFGFNQTSNLLTQKMEVGNIRIIDEYFELKATGFGVTPFFGYQRSLLNYLDVRLEVGYVIDFSNEFKIESYSVGFKPNWSGYQASMGLVLYLKDRSVNKVD
ncbi:MAG: hypothetical protein K8H85_07395 [Cyclobacteriaceae bacterium]|nr:hypothetical protein [Cyclobacteriaceae bacterium]